MANLLASIVHNTKMTAENTTVLFLTEYVTTKVSYISLQLVQYTRQLNVCSWGKVTCMQDTVIQFEAGSHL